MLFHIDKFRNYIAAKCQKLAADKGNFPFVFALHDMFNAMEITNNGCVSSAVLQVFLAEFLVYMKRNCDTDITTDENGRRYEACSSSFERVPVDIQELVEMDMDAMVGQTFNDNILLIDKFFL